MNGDDWVKIIGAVSAALIVILPVLSKFWIDIKQLKKEAKEGKVQDALNEKDREKTDTIGNSLKDKAVVTAKREGLIDMVGGRFYITDKGRSALDQFKPKLMAWYMEGDRHLLAFDELMWMIQKDLGKAIFNDVCLPNDMSNHECLIAAMLLCKETQIAESQKSQDKTVQPVIVKP